MDKATQLLSVLGRLSPEQACQLARAVELDHALGRDSLPRASILDALRPTLRVAKAPRVPTLLRLICAGIEDFLTDRIDDPRLEGLIPRASLAPWWQAVTIVAGAEIEALEMRLREQLAAPVPNLETLQDEAQQAAARWSFTLATDLPKTQRAAVRRLLPDLIQHDVDVIAHALTVARPLGAAMKTLYRVAARLNLLDDRVITDLSPDCVTLLKKEYLALSESHGMDARFLALAVLNRLAQPRQILRLGRALSWKPNDSLVASTEFSCVGARLIGEVERLARIVLLQMPRRGPLPSAGVLGAALINYLEESEGMLGEIGVRRDSPWRAAMLQTRSEIADALDGEFLERYAEVILALLPQAERPGRGANLAEAPSRDAIVAASEAAAFLKLLTQRGQRHGFAKAALETIDELGKELEDRIDDLCKAARAGPADPAVIEAQARAAAELCDELFDDGRSTALMRRVTAALRAPAA